MTDTLERFETRAAIDADGQNAVDVLHGKTKLSKQQIKAAMTKGAVWITRGKNTQRLRRAKRKLYHGDKLYIYFDAAILAQTPPEPLLVADVGEYSVWNKPYGMRSQGSKWSDHCTVVRWAEQHLQPERSAFTVHRLDRAANGLILVAHSKKTAAALSQLFEQRRIDKRYRATVQGDLSTQASPLRLAAEIDGKPAVSEVAFTRLSDDGSQSIVDVRIETGRKHQIRRHLAGLGHPIVGDRLYGSGEADGVDLQLSAYQLGFECPVSGKAVSYRLAD